MIDVLEPKHLSGDAFAQEVEAFLDTHFTAELRREASRQAGLYSSPALAARWHQILHRRGWVAGHWPRAYGGLDWRPRQRLIFEHVCAKENAPFLPPMGVQMCGPVLMHYGTPEQKARFLPPILSGEHVWCQGYSEPDAGSDLASLRCKAARDGDEYVVNGTKIWTTYAHVANWIFMLVRTDASVKRQQGISFLLVPMDSPGITVTPILSMSGEHEINQVFFDNVRVPVANRVGEEHDGWAIAKYLLEFERGGGLATARTVRVTSLLRRYASEGSVTLDRILLRRLAKLEIEIVATDWTQCRMLDAVEPGGSVGNANASILKLKASELFQEASALFHDATGQWGLLDERLALDGQAPGIGPAHAVTGAARYLNSRAISIFGGASEIQRTIIAKDALGL